MYFSAADCGEMMSMVNNWPADQVCITDLLLIVVNLFTLFIYK